MDDRMRVRAKRRELSNTVMDELLPLALPLPDSLYEDDGGAPRDGLQYLAGVVRERRRCRAVTRAPPPQTLRQNVFAPQPTSTLPAPHSLLPTAEWQNFQVADFSRVRNQISKLHDQPNSSTNSIILPPIETKQSAQLWSTFFADNEPMLSTIFKIEQCAMESILEILNDNLSVIPAGEGITLMHGRWLFAILAVLKLPLDPDMHSTLRNLARCCSKIRSRLSADDVDVLKKTAPLNLFICLIAKYFRQGDLADE